MRAHQTWRAVAARFAAVAAGIVAILPVSGRDAVAQSGSAATDVAVVARAMRAGEVVRVDVTCACAGAAPRVTAFGSDVPMVSSPDGARWQGLVGIDLDVAPGTYPLVVSLAGGTSPAHETALRVEPYQFATRTLTVNPAFVDPPAGVLERIRREASLLARLFKTTTERRWNDRFVSPLATPATPNFGSRSVFNGQPRSPHAGIDFRSPSGTTISAPAAGTVVLADDLYFTGNTVVLDHGAGLYSLFAHLSSMDVRPGAVVERGATLGRVGATGRVTGPHLHWSVRLLGARVDPLSLLAATDDRPASTR